MSAVAARLPIDQPSMRRLRKAFENAQLPDDLRLIGYLHWLPNTQLSALFTDEFILELGDRLPDQRLLETLNHLPPGASRLKKSLYLDTKHFLADHNLNYTDKMGMSAGVEVRVPFLDPDLVSTVYGISDRLKQRGSEGKWILKKAMVGRLPNDVIYRPKTGFGAPLHEWMSCQLRPARAELLSEAVLKRRGIFDVHAVRRLIKASDDGRIDATYPIFALMCIELWCQMFVDPDTPQITDFPQAVGTRLGRHSRRVMS